MKFKTGVLAVCVVAAFGCIGYAIYSARNDQLKLQISSEFGTSENVSNDPVINKQVVINDLAEISDITYNTDGSIFYAQSSEGIGVAKANTSPKNIYTAKDALDGPLKKYLSLAVDPMFVDNHYLYVCLSTKNDIRLRRLVVSSDQSKVTSSKDIVKGIPSGTDNSACHVRFGADSTIWLGTGYGDGNNSQDKKSLGGKVIHIDREGKPAAGNIGGEFDPRIYSYGHHSVAGFTFYSAEKNGIIGYSSDKGNGKDDELNVLSTGNFGWNAKADNGAGQMSDQKTFPASNMPILSSGNNNLEFAGIALLQGSKWKSWNNQIMVIAKKEKDIRLIGLDEEGKKVISNSKIISDYDSIGSIIVGADNDVYLGVRAKSGQNQIVKLSPS